VRIRDFLLFFLLLSFIGNNAQPELKIIGHITTADGLLTNGIKYTYKDSEGFMWFTFQGGFQRWNGNEAKNYSYLVDTNLNSAYRYCRPILEDKKGNFFIGSLNNGLIKLDRNTDTYIRYQHNPQNPENSMTGYGVNEMLLDSSGIIWLGTFEALTRFDPEAETFKNYILNPDIRYDPRNSIKSMLRDSDGTLWIGTANGLYKLDEKKDSLLQIITDPVIPQILSSFESMLEDQNGLLWFGTNWGILTYDRATDTWNHILTTNPDKPDSGEDDKIYKILEYHTASNHQIWIGTHAGLKVYDVNRNILTHITPKNGYPEISNAGAVQYLYIDDNDILWASLGGIVLFDLKGNEFDVHRVKSYPDSIYDERAVCFYEDDQCNIWMGTERNGLYQFDEKLNFRANYKADISLQNDDKVDNYAVEEIYEDPQGRVWMKTGPTHLSIFDMETGVFHPIDIRVKSYVPGGIVIDSYDIVWMASHDGLYMGKMEGDHDLQIELYENPGLPRTPIDGILYDSHNRLWIITRSLGVFCLHPENRDSMVFKQYFHTNYRKSFTIEYNARSMVEDPEGGIWFISLTELFQYDTVLDSIIPEEYFNSNYDGGIYSVIRDKNGVLWMGVDAGLLAYYYNPKGSGTIKMMDYRSGIPFTFLTRNHFFLDSKGYIYQGGESTTERGFFRFHPDSILDPNTKIPPVVLTKFNIKNKEYPLDSNITHKKHIHLNYDQNFFSFEFSALDYNGPEKNQFAYMLEGFNDEWVHTTAHRRFANYTGVSPGDYVFRVKASNNDGFWNEEGISVRVSITPPPWKTWWAYTLYGLAIITLIIAWRRYDLKRHRLEQALEVEQVEAEKLKELDSMKSRFFANISHEFRTPLTLILGPLDKLIGQTDDEKCVRDLNMMQRNARRLQRLINQLLNLSKLEAGEMKLIAGERNIVGLVRGYVHSFESLAKQKNIKLQFSSDDEKTLIYVDNDKIEKILYNLLSNAFKFTPEGGEISVSVLTHPVKPYYKEDAEGGINIIVADTGPGIPPDKVKRVFDRFYQADNANSGDMEGIGIGLALTQELVKLHHGNITVESKEGKGTTFFITLPKGFEHLKPEEIAEQVKTEALEAEILPDIPISEIKPGEEAHAIEEEGKPILLLVEDNDDLRSYVRSYLDEDYIVHEAVNGALGLQSAIEKIPDLVISDVMMPKMDGYQLCRALKSDERTSHIPMILLTAKAAKEDKIEGLELGADDFLTKPFDPAELQVRIRNLIDQRQSLRQKYLKELNLYPKSIAEESVSMDENFLHKAKAVIKENIADPEFSVENFGDKMAMSRMQLHRKITALTGQTAGEFIRSLRLQKAAQLILKKSATIAEIAYDTGFSTPSYFTESFKKYFGISPTDYQKE